MTVSVIILIGVVKLHANFKEEDLTITDSIIARQAFDQAKTLYRNGKLKEALGMLQKVELFKGQFARDCDPQNYKLFNRLAIVCRHSGDYSRALRYYEKALNNNPKESFRSHLYQNIAIIYQRKGEHLKSINYFEEAYRNLTGENDTRKNATASVIYYNLGFAYFEIGDYNKSYAAYKKALEYSNTYNKQEIGDIYAGLGKVYFKLGSNSKALKCLNKSISCNTEHYGEENYHTGLSYLTLGEYYLDLGKLDLSLENVRKASEVFRNTLGQQHAYTANSFWYMGLAYEKKGELLESVHYFQKAILSRIPSFTDTAIFKNPPSPLDVVPDLDLVHLVKKKAELLFKIYQQTDTVQYLINAFETYGLAADIIYQILKGYRYEVSMLDLAEREEETFEMLVFLSTELYRITNDYHYAEMAFQYSEKTKHAILRELRSNENSKIEADVPIELRLQEKALREQIGKFRMQIKNHGNGNDSAPVQTSPLQSQLFAAIRKLDSILNKMEYKYRINKSENDLDYTISIADVQESLRDGQACIEYMLAGSQLFSFLVTKNGYSIKRQDVDSNFYWSLNYYKKFLHSRYSLSYDSFRIAAYGLYETLLKPLESRLKVNSLLIIPDEELALMSFEALVVEPYREVQSVHYAYEPYLIKKYAIAYALSASMYVNPFIRSKKINTRTLAIAPDYKSSKDSLPELPSLKKYLAKITRFNGSHLSGEKAVESNVKSLIKDFGIIYLYAHGFEDKVNPSTSKIYLSAPTGATEDGHLHAFEISALNIYAELVVLASCYSGSGKVSEGEGVLSIGRSFRGSGAKSLVMSLWYAGFESTVEQLKAFRLSLKKGLSKDIALQQAKIKYLQEANAFTSHPRNWAGIVLVGNQQTIYANNFLYRYVGVIIGLLLVLSLIVYKKRRGRCN